MSKTILLTLGRLPKALELARAFHGAGHRVLIAEPFSWHVSRLSKAVAKTFVVTAPRDSKDQYLADLLAIVSRERVDLVVPISEETMCVAALRGRLPAGVDLYAPPQEVLLRLHNKRRFIEYANSLGMSVPETVAITDPAARDIASGGAYVLKPEYSCSGHGVVICKQGTPLPTASDETLIVQRFVPGQVWSSFTVAHQGRVQVTSIYKGTVMSGTVSVAFERADHGPVAAWVADFVAKSNHSGFISFDFIEDAAGRVSAIECNPRMTSGVHFIDGDHLARAVLDPEDQTPVGFKPERYYQQFYPCLTETQKVFFNSAKRPNAVQHLRQSKDVVWARNDPWPFVLMPVTSYQILAQTIFKGLSFGEAATRDIEWRDG
jgi:predicted ATP-grasp superfamily ATP-dependent carboligase